MPSKKLPALHFYPGDWFKDPGIMALENDARGVWFQMLLLMHESEQRGKLMLNGEPYPMKSMASVFNIHPNSLRSKIKTIIKCGVASVDSETNVIYSRRMVLDEEKRQVFVNAGKTGGRGNKKEKPPPFKKEKGSPENETDYENEKGIKVLKDNNEQIYSGNIQDLNLAESLAQEFEKNHEENIPRHELFEWADTIKSLRTFDKRTHAQILEKWAWANSGWWRENNIRVTPKMLRSKWYQIKKPGKLKIQDKETVYENKRRKIDEWAEESDEEEIPIRPQNVDELRRAKPG